MFPDQPDALVADERDVRSLDRPRPLSRARLGLKLAACAALITGLTLAARDRIHSPEPPRPWADPPRAEAARADETAARRAVAASEPLLILAARDPDLPPRVEPTRWDPNLGRREDGVSQGGFDAIEAPYFLVTATDTGIRAEVAPSLYVALVRRAADGRGLAVTRTGERGVVATRFGAVETLEITLAGAGSRACTGFRSLDLGAVHLDGWLCGILGQAPEPRAVACAIDRITLSGRVAATLGAGAPSSAEPARGGEACGSNEIAKAAVSDRTGSIAGLGALAGAGVVRQIAAKTRRK
ncbi:hypothetical protein [Methylobacterium sp. Leaf118]|uniref:hypothetical protein n=1 Tax=Methylobacterium sp. Leaf118 TaxID=2876562 RepID=UPI001E2896D5|nr:hypothetical protein [Methylobacterium sp. Leaf118]